MDLSLLARTLALRTAWRARDRWSTEQLADHDRHAVEVLRQHAFARSAFYRRHHAGMARAPLQDLPIVTKADLMSAFDEAVTDPGLRLRDVDEHLRTLVARGGDPGRPWRGRWWVAATAGTTGRRGVFVWNRTEWATVLASYARANGWAGVRVGVRQPLRVAVVSSLVPTHQSAVVGASLQSRLVPTLRLDATAPIQQTVAALNDFRPRVLVGYASALRPLATEQRAGRLQIAPQAVMSASEVLSAAAARELAEAWGSTPYNVYAATETAGLASPCELGRLHLYEDLVICEVVDATGAPVAPGDTGSRLLVTVLFSRTLPLIRYELTDRVTLSSAPCPCGKPFRTLDAVEGRLEDMLQLPGLNGDVTVHPNVFHDVLDGLMVNGWQVVQEPDGLHLLLAGATDVDLAALTTRLGDRLRHAGVQHTRIRVQLVATIPKTLLGKSPLVRALPHETRTDARGSS